MSCDIQKGVKDVDTKGFSILNSAYTDLEIFEISNEVEAYLNNVREEKSNKSKYAIRQLLVKIPQLKTKLLNPFVRRILSEYYHDCYFLTKALYFNKINEANWFVPYHQDLSITVNQKQDIDGFKNWTFKEGQYGVEPPVKFLENTLTIRIHLDNTNSKNGALKVLPFSHNDGVITIKEHKFNSNSEEICQVAKGAVMLMKPLTLHASNRSKNNKPRRVIHLEFNTMELPLPLQWQEKLSI